MAFATPEIGRAYYARYRVENKDKLRASGKAFREANKERLKVSQRQYRQTNHAAILARQKAYRESDAGKDYHTRYITNYLAEPRNRMRYLVRQAALRAKENCLEFEPSLKELLMENPPMVCGCCDREFNFTAIGKGQEAKWESPSLDRFDNSKGYTVGNVRVICVRCNSLKSDATLTEMQTIVRYMSQESSPVPSSVNVGSPCVA